VQYNFRDGAHELLLWLGSPSPAEVADIRQGEAEFALVVEPPVIVLLYRFGRSIRWSDAPYSWHRVPAGQRTLPEPLPEGEEGRALLQIVLVDAATGIVRALRAVTLAPAFTAALHLAIREQARQPWDSNAYDRALQRLYARYPTSEAMLAQAAARTTGGR
jgi:hypothetical protein